MFVFGCDLSNGTVDGDMGHTLIYWVGIKISASARERRMDHCRSSLSYPLTAPPLCSTN